MNLQCKFLHDLIAIPCENEGEENVITRITQEMEKRTDLYGKGDDAGIKSFEKELIAQNAEHTDWQFTEELMKTIKDGRLLYLNYLQADISGVSCEVGEVDATVFKQYRKPLYKQASWKPYAIASMVFLSKVKNPQEVLAMLENNKNNANLNNIINKKMLIKQ